MNKNAGIKIDWSLLLPVVVLAAISLITLFSLNPVFFQSQIVFLFIAFVGYIIVSQTNYKILRLYSVPIYIVSLVLLILVLILGIESRGSIRWIEIFGFRIQFSEILKPFLAVSFAGFLSGRKQSTFKNLIISFLFLAPVVILIFLQPDLGDALLYTGVVIAMLIYAGYSFKYFIAIFLPIVGIMPIIWNFLHDYQKQRVLTFLDPTRDPLGTSYNVIQSVIAVGSGMLLGRGIGEGTQSTLRFLPERQTDFIFATITEQLGFIGSIIILLSFGVILYRIYIIFSNSDEKFTKILSAAIFFSFLIQIFVNVGMNAGILPIVGVTLPFVSYGGSSLLSNFIFLGLLSSIARASKRKEILEIH